MRSPTDEFPKHRRRLPNAAVRWSLPNNPPTAGGGPIQNAFQQFDGQKALIRLEAVTFDLAEYSQRAAAGEPDAMADLGMHLCRLALIGQPTWLEGLAWHLRAADAGHGQSQIVAEAIQAELDTATLARVSAMAVRSIN